MTVKERDIALDFKTILKHYTILVPNNITERGWPDRLIQLPKSVVIPCELKRVFVNKSGYYVLSDLRQEQCAWLAKWQYNGGKCFVFVGLIRDGEFLGYHCITVNEWRDWLYVSKEKRYAVYIKTSMAVLEWFEDYCRA